ncbi:GNAT family N-acetyltransferase [Roseibacterium sp. SDUM158016]|uniref:GNAT family N-acetyltransferase n=1 Tax=Roseicyclus sediminis TaxID=2980997 RepID=UPI0021D2B39B|nr:GNAT family N-acetyltransferase [Roseibacterium sp. SDUM158016]MCU4654739.1 GNAT family N-acetyltransferase [Roseibacterium sp. SDUM158016]
MNEVEIAKVRNGADIEATAALVWEFFDFLKGRYPEMVEDIDTYIERQEVAARLADFAANYNPPYGECLLARHAGSPVGMVMVRPRPDGDAELNRMYVRAAARGTGTGRALCAGAIETARALGYPAIRLGALDRHVEAIPLYESFGFRRVPDPIDPDAGNSRVILMRLDLSGPPLD